MQPVKLTIIYYSSTGTNYQIARAMQISAETIGAEVRLRKVRELAPEAAIRSKPAWQDHMDATRDIPEATLDDLEWGDAYIFGSPVRFGNIAAQMKQFIDTTGPLWAEGQLADKVVSGFTSASNVHGGQETALLALYNMFYHWGSFIVPPGYTDDVIMGAGGNPYGTSATANNDGTIPDAVRRAAEHQARRVVQVAEWFKLGQLTTASIANVS